MGPKSKVRFKAPCPPPPSSLIAEGTLILCLMHAMMGVLQFYGRATPAILTNMGPGGRFRVVALIADDKIWVAFHLMMSLAFIFAWLRDHTLTASILCVVSGTGLVWWGCLVGLWAQTSLPPTSLATALLSVSTGGFAFVLSQTWATRRERLKEG